MLDKKMKDYISIYLDGMLPKGSIPPSQELIDEYLKEKGNIKNYIYFNL